MAERSIHFAGELPSDRAGAAHYWPNLGALDGAAWHPNPSGPWLQRAMPESEAELAGDSRWPAFFPSALSIATSSDGTNVAIEKVVGASIVNRFPYTLAISVCRQPLSARHYVRNDFMDVVERSGCVALQFLMPGTDLQRALAAIASVSESNMSERLAVGASSYRSALRSSAPVLDAAYLVYEGRFVKPGRDFEGVPIHATPWIDCGSHRIYLFEIETISLKDEIASGHSPIHWRSLPAMQSASQPPPATLSAGIAKARASHLAKAGYTKTYRADYVFPSNETIVFAGLPDGSGFSVLDVPPLAGDQVEVDNDRARWPCFFPSSLGMITAVLDGQRTAFPCGSTAVVSRSPLTFAICVSYARINARYAPRASLEIIRASRRFGCGCPVYRPELLDAIAYLGNVSLRDDPLKVVNSGLSVIGMGGGFGFAELPVHFDCRVVKEIRLGTHSMFFGEVENIFVSSSITPEAPLEWCPWAGSMAPLKSLGQKERQR